MFIVPITPMATQPVTAGVQSNNAVENIKEGTKSFAEYVMDSVKQVKELEAASDQSAYDISVGNRNDIENVLIESAKASTAVEATVQIVTRAVNAYKSIVEMQI